MIDQAKLMDIKVLALCYDGLIIEKTEAAKKMDFMKQCEERIMDKWGLVMPLEEKKMEDPMLPKELKKYSYPNVFNSEFFTDLNRFTKKKNFDLVFDIKCKIEKQEAIIRQFESGKKRKEAKALLYKLEEEVNEIEHKIEQELFNRRTSYFEQFHAKVKYPAVFLYHDHDLEKIVQYSPADICSVNTNLQGANPKLPYIAEWRAYVKCRTYEALDFLPPPLQCPDNVFNLYTGLLIEKTKPDGKEHDITPILNHIDYLCNSEHIVTKHLLYLLAQIAQQPGLLNEVAVVLHSLPGTGKNLLLECFFRVIFSIKYLLTTSQLENSVTSRFSSVPNKIGVVLDEVKFKTAAEVENVMKNFITAPTLEWEQKGVKAITVRNFARYFFLSNDAAPIKITAGDRRYFVIRCEAEPKPRQYYKDILAPALHDPQTMRAFYDYLMNIDLSEWDPKDIPMTESKKDLMMVSNDPILTFIQDFVESHEEHKSGMKHTEYEVLKNDDIVVDSKYLYTHYSEWCSKKQIKPTTVSLFRVRVKKELKAKYYRHTFADKQKPAVKFAKPIRDEDPELELDD
jgi:hypothetical protein